VPPPPHPANTRVITAIIATVNFLLFGLMSFKVSILKFPGQIAFCEFLRFEAAKYVVIEPPPSRLLGC
jgi:hypothetical protein